LFWLDPDLKTVPFLINVPSSNCLTPGAVFQTIAPFRIPFRTTKPWRSRRKAMRKGRDVFEKQRDAMRLQ